MSLSQPWTFKGLSAPNSYHRIVGLSVDVLDRDNPRISIVLHAYANAEQRGIEREAHAPSREAIDTGIQIVFSQDGLQFVSAGARDLVETDEVKAVAEGLIAAFAPQAYETIKSMVPAYAGAEDV
jgi:hypothetical protein